MRGLYLLSTKLLQKNKTIKFGMSMRLECRWQDYLTVFNDAKYEYYYEFLDELTREEILEIEQEIINIHIKERNPDLQTEYFFCDNYELFHLTIINVLNKKNIQYKYHNKHDFEITYYDNKPEIFRPNNNIIKSEYYI